MSIVNLNWVGKDKASLRQMILMYWILLWMTACQAIGGDNISATLSNELTAFVTESTVIQQTAIVEQTDVVETLQASGTSVADAANVNLVLAATVQASIDPTPSLRQVIVNPDDMGSSLETEMMEDGETEISREMQVTNLGIAQGVGANDGCSDGVATQFTDADEEIYVTARVVNMLANTNFSVDWMFEERLIYRSAWTADYTAEVECIWFYMNQDDATFLPGTYTVTLYVNGNAELPQQFSISAG